MRDALNRTGRNTGKPVLYSTEPFHLTPNPQAHISNLWRTTTDVAATTAKVRVNLDLNDKWAEFAGYNDFDIILDHFPRVFQLNPTPHAPRAVLYLVPRLT